MKTPKLLPWYAAKAGVPLERAEALWRKAVQKATADTGWVATPAYWDSAMTHFRALLDAESTTLCTPDIASLARRQSRIMRLPLTFIEVFFSAFAAYMQRCARHAQRTAC